MQIFLIFFLKIYEKNVEYWVINILLSCNYPLKGVYVGESELGGLGGTWEGYDVADILHTCDEEDETLETESEAGVWA